MTDGIGRTLFALTLCVVAVVSTASCDPRDAAARGGDRLEPVVVTERVDEDSDDPAVWIDPVDPSKSLVLGTDKGGALFAFTLDGKRLDDRTVKGLDRPNNVDVEYGLSVAGKPTDIAVCTERDGGRIRVFALPDLEPIDGGGIGVFAGEPNTRAMGVGLFKRPSDGAIFAIVARKDGADGSLLWQYRIEGHADGKVRATHVRSFGHWRGPEPDANGDTTNEVEAVFVDDALGFVYYAEESHGIHKYAVDPDAPRANDELALFGTTGFAGDREGISVLATGATTGYLLVSDQQAQQFRVFPREGRTDAPHAHDEVAVVPVLAHESDGSECVTTPLLPRFPHGLFVAMSDDRTFQLYDAAALLSRIEAQLAQRVR